MPTPTNLAGLGMAAMLAAAEGNEPTTATATGTGSQANSVLLKSSMSKLITAGGTDSFILPASTAFDDAIGKPYFVWNASATTAVVFVPVGHTLIAAGSSTLNGSLGGIAQNRWAMFLQVTKSTWVATLFT